MLGSCGCEIDVKVERLDMSRIAIRDKVSHAINTDELDQIFDTDGVIE